MIVPGWRDNIIPREWPQSLKEALDRYYIECAKLGAVLHSVGQWTVTADDTAERQRDSLSSAWVALRAEIKDAMESTTALAEEFGVSQ